MPPALLNVVTHLRRVAGPDRTAADNRHLAAGLAFTAGMLNSVGFLAVALYTSHMTGLTATLADQLVLGDHRLALLAALGIGAFVVGAASCALLFNALRRRQVASRFAVVLVVEALAMLLVGLLADSVTAWGHGWAAVAVLCWTMGLQNALVTKVTGSTIRTTHVTGMVTDLGIELGKWLYRNPPGDPDPVRADRQRMALHATLVGAFVLGGVAGAVAGVAVGYRAVVVPAALLLVLALFPIVDDLRGTRPGRV